MGNFRYTLEVDYLVMLVMGRGIMRGSGMHGKQPSLNSPGRREIYNINYSEQIEYLP